jgi:hypothetical protein
MLSAGDPSSLPLRQYKDRKSREIKHIHGDIGLEINEAIALVVDIPADPHEVGVFNGIFAQARLETPAVTEADPAGQVDER